MPAIVLQFALQKNQNCFALAEAIYPPDKISKTDIIDKHFTPVTGMIVRLWIVTNKKTEKENDDE